MYRKCQKDISYEKRKTTVKYSGRIVPFEVICMFCIPISKRG